MGAGTLGSCSVHLCCHRRLTDTAQSPARLVWVSEPPSGGQLRGCAGDRRAGSGLGHPGLAELCHPPG